MKSPEEIAEESIKDLLFEDTAGQYIAQKNFASEYIDRIAKVIQDERDRPTTVQLEDGSLVCSTCEELRKENERLKWEKEHFVNSDAHKAEVTEKYNNKLRTALKEAVEALENIKDSDPHEYALGVAMETLTKLKPMVEDDKS